jgi:hypothetical protein
MMLPLYEQARNLDPESANTDDWAVCGMGVVSIGKGAMCRAYQVLSTQASHFRNLDLISRRVHISCGQISA